MRATNSKMILPQKIVADEAPMHVHLRDPKLLPPSISNKQKTTLDFNKLTS